jgi:hypothetical protein
MTFSWLDDCFESPASTFVKHSEQYRTLCVLWLAELADWARTVTVDMFLAVKTTLHFPHATPAFLASFRQSEHSVDE